MDDYESPHDKIYPQEKVFATIEYYRKKSNPGYFYCTVTLHFAPHLHIYISSMQHSGKIYSSSSNDTYYSRQFQLPVGETLRIIVGNDHEKRYEQVNFYIAKETEIVFDEERSDILFTFLPIELINLEASR